MKTALHGNRKRKESPEGEPLRQHDSRAGALRLQQGAACLLIAAAVFALYLPLFGHEFHELWDDGTFVTKNAAISKGFTFEGVKWAFSNLSAGFYYPVTWLTHMLDIRLWGMDPSGHYLTNIIIHALNAVLLFLVLGKITERTTPRLAFAGIFAVHPMNVECVAWVAERKSLLAAFFLLLALWAYAKSLEKGRQFTVAAHIFFLLGLMSKSSIVVFPLLLILMDFWPLGRIHAGESAFSIRFAWSLLKNKLLFFALSLLFGIVTIVAQKGMNATASLGRIHFSEKVGEAFLGYGFYLLKFFLPLDLCALYPHHRGDYPLLLPLSIAVTMVAATLLFLRIRKTAAAALTGWVFFVVSLLPVIGLIQVGWQAYADRYPYFAYWGILAAIVFGVGWEKALGVHPLGRIVLPLISMAFILSLFLAARNHLSTWKNDETLFRNVVRVSPNAELAYFRLGNYYKLVKKDNAEALSCYERALELKPGGHEILNNMAACHLALGDAVKAAECASRSIGASPESSSPHYNRACALLSLKRADEAQDEAALAVKFMADRETDRAGLAGLLVMIGKSFGAGSEFVKAERAFREAVRLDPGSTIAWCDLGHTLVVLGKTREALSALERAAELDPSGDIPYYELAMIDLRAGEPEKARARLRTLAGMSSPLAAELEKNIEAVAGTKVSPRDPFQ